MQKLAVDAGFSCPNRDGRLSTGGCTFCNNDAFNTSYCDRRKSITRQLEDGKRFFGRKQAGTNTWLISRRFPTPTPHCHY